MVRATCVNGEVTVPTVTPPTIDQADLHPRPAGPYDPGTEDYQVIVTATLGDGLNWGTMPPGWVQTSLTTAVYVVQLPAGSCTEAIPVPPGVNEAVCPGGELHPPTLTPVETDGITYSYDADAGRPYAPAQTVLVTATLDDAGGRLARPAPRRLDRNILDNGDLRRHVRRCGLYPGGSGGSGGDAGDVRQRGGDRADRGAGNRSDRCHLQP